MNVLIVWGETRNKYHIRQCGTRELLHTADYLTEARDYIKRKGWICCGLVEH